MVLLTTTPEILSAISLLPADSPLHASASPSLPPDLETPISHQALISLSRALRHTESNQKFSLNTLLHKTTPWHPVPAPPAPPTAAYLALKSQLQRAQEEREYHALIRSRADADAEGEAGTDDISPSLVLNILLSVVLCAFAVFYATRGWRGRDGGRVLLALGAGVVVAVAETGIYAAYLRKVKAARRREAARREVKEVMGGAGEDGMVGWGEGKEEIWGKGANGGLRRRVRERWEKERERQNT